MPVVYVWRYQRPAAYRTIQRVTRSCLSADPTRCVSRPDIVRSGASRRWHLARLALAQANRGVRLEHQAVRLALGRLEHRESGSRRFYRPLDHFDRTACLRFKRGLDVFDHSLELLIRQLLDQIALF